MGYLLRCTDSIYKNQVTKSFDVRPMSGVNTRHGFQIRYFDLLGKKR